MSKLAFVFPGQGSQSVGMGKSFFESFDIARKTFEEANDALGFDIARLSFEGPQEEIDKTEITQPALLTASIAALRVLNEKTDLKPAYLSGHSLGEYTALVAAGSLEFRDAVKLVHLRGKFMQESVPQGVGRMCAILGLGIEDVQVICDSASIDAARVVPANINSPEQIVISGHAAAVEIAANLAKERGAKRVVPLQVSAPSHSPLMEAAAERLAEELNKITFKDFNIPVLTNVEAKPLSDASKIKGLLKDQLTSPVRWVDIIRRMKQDGVANIIEVGPGKVLTGLIKRIEKEINSFNLNEASELEKITTAFQ
ncbi:MAG: ACP S-malonyltransferase [Deltaproteobacteria bacterium]|nr:ACP S-malonyltransferase [Deltaproteobacteria bacterium]